MLPTARPSTSERGRAFGLELAAEFPFPGLLPATGSTIDLRLVRTPRRDLDARWPASSETLLERRRDTGPVVYRIASALGAGYRITALGAGAYRVDVNERVVECAPARQPRWQWQRFLAGQVLPFAATLHGIEPFHASAVARDGRAIAFTGRSGAGKSTVALRFVADGWDLVTDDVLCLACDPAGVVVAHAAPSLVNLRKRGGAELRADLVATGASTLGEDDESWRLELRGCDSPTTLTAVFVLRRVPDGALEVVRQQPVDPMLLLGAGFTAVPRDPARLARQLDVCAAVAVGVPVYEVLIPPSAAAKDVQAKLRCE